MLKKILALVLACAMIATLAISASAQKEFAEKQWFEIGDYTICYRVVPAQGEETGRIFFIHGMVSSTIYWDSLSALFSQAGYLSAMIDLPGFGYSTRESKDITPITREIIIAELMEEIAPGEAWIVAGHSMGGGVALNMAVIFPEKVSALLLYAPAGGGGHGPPGGGWMAGISPELAGCVMNLLLRPLLYMHPVVRLLAGIANADLCYGLTYDIDRIVKPLKLPGTVQSLFYMSQRATPVDLVAAAQLTVPILIIWAQRDYIVTSQALSGALPWAETQIMHGGHMMTEQFPEEAFERSIAFLQKSAV